jgi:hypothetical protein
MTQTVGLNPALDQANQSMMGQLGSSWATPLDNGQQARQHAENALYQQGPRDWIRCGNSASSNSTPT